MICEEEIIKAGLPVVHRREDGAANKSYMLEEINKLLAQEEAEWRRKKKVELNTAEQTQIRGELRYTISQKVKSAYSKYEQAPILI